MLTSTCAYDNTHVKHQLLEATINRPDADVHRNSSCTPVRTLLICCQIFERVFGRAMTTLRVAALDRRVNELSRRRIASNTHSLTCRS